MRKVLFLMFLLLLMGLGAAGVRAQVRIGGNIPPNRAAALDLNADESATPAGNKGALALPRVSLASTTAQLNGATPISGMLVYNTNASMTGGNGLGIYLWNGSQWLTVTQGSLPLPHAVQWYTSYSDSVTFTRGAANTVLNIPAPGVMVGDFCLPSLDDYGETWQAGNSAVTVYNYVALPGTWRILLRCFRAYTLN